MSPVLLLSFGIPFELNCDPRFVFYTERHRKALTILEDGLLSARPLTLLLGDAGTGKTTLFRSSLQSERCRHIKCLRVANPTLLRDGLVDALLTEFGIDARKASSPLDALRASLCESRSRGLTHAIVIDEAETLSDGMLDELDRLAAMEANSVHLLPAVLAGQFSLESKLDQPGLARLKARVSLRSELAPLDLFETASYILWRTSAAGAVGGKLFTREAVVIIHQCSRGIPRTINVISDNALLSGFSRKVKPVTREVVREVCHHLDLGNDPNGSAPAMRERNVRSTAAAS